MPLALLIQEHSRFIFLAERRRMKRRLLLAYSSAFVVIVVIASLPLTGFFA